MMTNPNPDGGTAAGRHLDQFDDPDFDVMAWINTLDFLPPAEAVHERAIRQWLEAAGFIGIDLRRVFERGPDAWQVVMRSGTNGDCPTGLAAEAMLTNLAADLGCRIQGGESSGIAWGDQIGVSFRLRPAA
jgi:hypothetical protein